MNDQDTLFSDIELYLSTVKSAPESIIDHETPPGTQSTYHRLESRYAPPVLVFVWGASVASCIGCWYLAWCAFQYFLGVK